MSSKKVKGEGKQGLAKSGDLAFQSQAMGDQAAKAPKSRWFKRSLPRGDLGKPTEGRSWQTNRGAILPFFCPCEARA